MTRSEAFTKLKPLCVQLTKEHTRNNMAKLFGTLKGVDIACLQDLQEYVIFPLRIVLKHPRSYSNDLYVDVFMCMEYVIGHTQISRWELFQDIFNIATSLLSCPTDHTKAAMLPEELKLAIVQTIRTLVQNSEFSVLQNLYTTSRLPLVGHAVSLLLNIADKDRARDLRLLAMECLLILSQADSKFSPCVKSDIGGLFASFIPGVSLTLGRIIINSDAKQSSVVTTKAIYVWMRLVSLVMDDKLLDVCRKKQAKQDKQDKATKHKGKTKNHFDDEDVDMRLDGLLVVRDCKWISSTSVNLSLLVKRLSNVRSHSNWRVRLGLVECAEHLLLHCSCSMKDCVPAFLEILVSLIGDDYSQVAKCSRHALELYSQSQAGEQQNHLTEILEENLHKLTTSLPRQIQTAGEEDKLSLLNLLSGYLTLLGTKVKTVLLSLPHLKRLSLALVQILEMDCNDIKIVETRTAITGHGCSAISGQCEITQPKKYFKHFNNEQIFHQIQGICHLLGYYGDINLLVDHFLDIFHEGNMFRMQATLVINEMMYGTTGENVCVNSTKNGRNWNQHSKDELDWIVRMLIDEYLNPVNFDLQTCSPVQPEDQSKHKLKIRPPSTTDKTTALQMNRNILQLCMFMEGFACFSKVLKSDFMPFLMRVLYPLLEKLGDDSAYLSNAAYLSLWDICQSCNYGSLDALIRENADYLVNDISLRLRHFNTNRRCPLVLKVMLQYCRAELLPLIDDTIQEIFECLDGTYEEEAVLFMGVLHELAKAISKWFQIDIPLRILSAIGLEKSSVRENSVKESSTISKSSTTSSNSMMSKSSTSSSSITDMSDGAVGGDSSASATSEQCAATVKCAGDNNNVDTADNEKTRGVKSDSVVGVNTTDSSNSVAGHLPDMPVTSDQSSEVSSVQSGVKNLKLSDNAAKRICDCCGKVMPNEDGASNKRIKTEQNANAPDCLADGVCHAGCGFCELWQTHVYGRLSSRQKGEYDSGSQNLLEFFVHHLQQEALARGEINEEDLNDSSEPSNPEDAEDDQDVEEPLPAHVCVLREVMLRCKHVISSHNPRLRLLVLDTIKYSAAALQPHLNMLLPLIHEIWLPFLRCFTDEEKLVTIRAVETLKVICMAAGDFMCQRVLKDVVPRLSKYLESQAKISIRGGSAYQYSVNYKLQMAILKHCFDIFIEIGDVTSVTIVEIVHSIVLYLSNKQPKSLQDACVECCVKMALISPDIMWLTLCELHCPKDYTPPGPFFKMSKKLKAKKSNEYSANVILVMKEARLLQ